MAIKTLHLEKVGSQILIESPTLNKRTWLRFNSTYVEVVNDKCIHRGGPLHLCSKASDGKKICPWHGRSVEERPSADFAIVYYPSDGNVIIVSDHSAAEPWPIKMLLSLAHS